MGEREHKGAAQQRPATGYGHRETMACPAAGPETGSVYTDSTDLTSGTSCLMIRSMPFFNVI
jgi:hypothetical protein